MSSRILKILQLAKEQNASSQRKDSFKTVNVTEKDPFKTVNVTEKGLKENISVDKDVKDETGPFISTFFTPLVQNETESLANGLRFNLNIEDVQAILPAKVRVSPDSDLDFDSDNLVKDPDFEVSLSSGSTSPSLREAAISLETNLIQFEGESSQPQKKGNSRKEIQSKRNAGQSYITKSKVIAQRNCIALTNQCRKKCGDKINFAQQKEVFDKYWALGTYNTRALYISSLVEIEDKKTQKLQKSTSNPKNRQYAVNYYVQVKDKRENLCQKCFLMCFGETLGFIRTVQKKKIDGSDFSLADKRGCTAPLNKICDAALDSVKEHIYSFPSYESHYSRRHTAKKYLSSELTLTKMYELYVEKFKDIKISLSTFSKVFHTTGLKFKSPKIDSCHTCDLIKAQIDIARANNSADIRKLEIDLEDHHLKADLAYKAKENDKVLSKSNPSIKTYTFDLQQCLPTPKLNTSVSFYKRQLWTFNLTVHDGVTGQPFCYMWHEALARRGANEIGSCLFKHLKYITLSSQIKHVKFFSDSCPGQNKNSFLSIMFMMFLYTNDNIQLIDHKFLVPGHTHMECDVDHSVIERKKKKTESKIHHPRDWYNFISNVGTKTKFTVVEMEKNDFWNFSKLLKSKFIWRNRSCNSEAFIWKNVKWLRYDKSHFGKIFYKNSVDENEEFKVLNIAKRGIPKVQLCDLENLSEEVKISKQKKQDLLDMLPLIHPCFHEFYKNLPTDEIVAPETHPDLTEEDSNEEEI